MEKIIYRQSDYRRKQKVFLFYDTLCRQNCLVGKIFIFIRKLPHQLQHLFRFENALKSCYIIENIKKNC